jgi:hypothetical protein
MNSAQVVFVFCAPSTLAEKKTFFQIKEFYPQAHILGCTTAGEICGTQVLDDSIVTTAVQFEYTEVRGTLVKLKQVVNSYDAGELLVKNLPQSILGKTGKDQKLNHLFVLSDGLKVNGSELVRGLSNHLPEGVTITGGLAGDGDRFSETHVIMDGQPEKETIALLGFYGDRLHVGFGSLGGWDSFGPERIITRSNGNVLFELDGQSALELYKRYLGEHAKGLPATGLLFPLGIRMKSGETGVVRTILSIDEKEQTMTFAGDVPEGSYARFMKANFDRLIDGAIGAARASYQGIARNTPALAILISCVGRKLILKQRIEEEVEGVRDILGSQAVLAGFYSYGEISPFALGTRCELHNQSMTITTLFEE